MSIENYRIPYRVNKPLIVLFFTMDQFIPIFIAMMLGYTFKAGIESMIFAIIYFQFSSYFSSNFPRGHVEHTLWYWGLLKLKLGTTFPDPMKREFIR